MRILHIINSLKIGGAETFIGKLLPAIRQLGHSVEVCVLEDAWSPTRESLQRNGIPVYHSKVSRLYDPHQVLAIRKHLAHSQFDVVHVHLFPAQLWVRMAASGSDDIMLVTTEHSTSNRRRHARLYRWLDAFVYSRYNAIVAISDGTERALVRWMPSATTKVTVIPNGLDLGECQNASGNRREFGIYVPESVRLAVFVARFDTAKDHATLIRALKCVQGIHLILVGDGPTRPEVANLAERTGVAGRVTFLGERADVPKILKVADVYVQSVLWEGFGLATLEAMAAGVPVVATAVEGLTDVVGDAALLFDVGDHRTLAKHLTTVLSDEALASSLRARGLKRAAEFSIARSAERYEAVYDGILHRSNRF